MYYIFHVRTRKYRIEIYWNEHKFEYWPKTLDLKTGNQVKGLSRITDSTAARLGKLAHTPQKESSK